MSRARCWAAPPPGITPKAGSNWPKIAVSRAANRMSHASTNSLPAPRTRPSICAMVTRRLALRWRNIRAIEASPVSFAASSRYSSIRVTSTWEMK